MLLFRKVHDNILRNFPYLIFARLYVYLLVPCHLFHDGYSELIYFQISIENDYLGPRRIESLQKEDADWQRKAHMAVLSIQDLTVKYFEITAKAQKGNGQAILHLLLELSV